MASGYTITNIGGYFGVLYPDGTLYTPFGDNANCTVSACPIDLSVYGYRPTFAGSVALIALYALCAIAQIILGVKYKSWGFMAAMVLGCIDEIIGYVGRVLLNRNPWGHEGFIIQIVLITMGPVFFSAAIYVMIYKIINYIDPKAARTAPRWYYWFFITCDVLALVLQAVGGAMSSTSNGSSTAGVNIAIAGLAFQVATLFFFSLAVADYAWRVRSTVAKYGVSKNFKIFASFLGIATLTIFIRCCYRVYELSEGYTRTSKALRDEPAFIGLEMVMVIVAAYALIVAHPGPVFSRGLPGPAEKRALETGEKTRNAVGASGESD